MKLLVGVPTSGMVTAETTNSLVNAMMALPDNIEAELAMYVGTVIHWNRNTLVREAISMGADWLLMVDSDMAFQSNAFAKMIALDKDIVSVHYNTKTKDPVSVVELDGKYADDYIQKEVGLVHPSWSLSNMANPFRCVKCGCGLLLVKVEVFRKIGPPWFMFGEREGKPIGEDVWFCEAALNAGYEIWIDPSIHCLHIGKAAY